jgi:hypothetical protein
MEIPAESMQRFLYAFMAIIVGHRQDLCYEL